MADVLFVSKPIAPPWNDSGKNLVFDLAASLQKHRPIVLTPRGVELELPRAVLEPLYPAKGGGFAPALVDNARVMSRLVFGRRADAWHFFFAPNPKSSMAARAALTVRRVPSLHTVSSGPRDDASARAMSGLFFSDRIAVLSRFTEQRLIDAGIERGRLARVPPAIAPLEPLTADARHEVRTQLGLPHDAPVVVYPGDLELGGGAELIVDAMARVRTPDARLVMACRAKTGGARAAEAALRERESVRALGDRVVWVGETRGIHALLGAADLVALPARSLYAKMDYPLVLLEAMSLERPVIVTRGTAAEELTEGGAAIAVEPDEEALASEIARVLEDAQGRAAIGGRARSAVLREFTRERMAASYEALYDAILSERAS